RAMGRVRIDRNWTSKTSRTEERAQGVARIETCAACGRIAVPELEVPALAGIDRPRCRHAVDVDGIGGNSRRVRECHRQAEQRGNDAEPAIAERNVLLVSPEQEASTRVRWQTGDDQGEIICSRTR